MNEIPYKKIKKYVDTETNFLYYSLCGQRDEVSRDIKAMTL